MARHSGSGVSALFAAEAPSHFQRPDFPYGLPRESALDIIHGVYTDRPKMLESFGKMIFYDLVSKPLSEWVFQLGLLAASWATAAIAYTWLDEEALFEDFKTIKVPTLILHGLNDQVCLYPLAVAQANGIKVRNPSRLKTAGIFCSTTSSKNFNKEFLQFAGE